MIPYLKTAPFSLLIVAWNQLVSPSGRRAQGENDFAQMQICFLYLLLKSLFLGVKEWYTKKHFKGGYLMDEENKTGYFLEPQNSPDSTTLDDFLCFTASIVSYMVFSLICFLGMLMFYLLVIFMAFFNRAGDFKLTLFLIILVFSFVTLFPVIIYTRHLGNKYCEFLDSINKGVFHE